MVAGGTMFGLQKIISLLMPRTSIVGGLRRGEAAIAVGPVT